MVKSISGVEQKWLVLVAVGLGTFMTALDTSVTNTLLPVIRQDLQTGVASVEWVVTIYLLTISGLLLGFGRLGDIHGHKRIYMSGFVLFILSSGLCGVAASLPWLIFSRGLQALGASMLAANSPAILTKAFPGNQRGRALGLQATMTYLGLTAGPSFGGWLAQAVNWRTVFWVNIPIGLAALVVSSRFIANDQGKGSSERFDFLGAGTFLVGLVTLLMALNRGADWGWNSPLILGLLSMAVLLLALFLWLESRRPAPMLDLSLFRNPTFALAVVSAILNYVTVNSVMFLLPFYLIQGRGLNSAQAGLLLTAQPIIMALVAPLSGSLSDRRGTRLPSMLGMGILAGGVFLLAQLDSTSAHIHIIIALGVVGLGTGIFISPNNSALMGAAPRQRQGIAAGILATARNVGMVLGVGLSGAIFTTLLNQGVIPAIKTSFSITTAVALLGIFTSWGRQE